MSMAQNMKPGEDLYKAFNHFLYYYNASGLACGVILVKSAHMTERAVTELKDWMEKEEPETAAQFCYDRNIGILGVLLDDRSIGYTHYYSLYIKDFLEAKNLLKGRMILAGVPDSCEYSEKMLADMIREISSHTDRDGAGEVSIYRMEDGAGREKAASLLLVDSDELVHQFLKTYFQRKGYTVFTAKDGMEGLRLCEEQHPDLVITELNLPVLGGYQLIERIRSGSGDDNKSVSTQDRCKIMVLTDKRLEYDVRRSFELGVSEYMTKPFSLVELEARIQRLLAE